MADGSDAIADWPLLNALVNTASGRQLGVDPPRRRGRHRPLDPRRPGLAGRRHRAGRAEAGPGADQRPRHGRHPARRRRLRPRRRGRRRSGASGSRCARATDCAAEAGSPGTADSFDRHVGRRSPTSGATRHRRLPALRLDRRGPRAARVVRRGGDRAAGSTWSRTGWATSGPGGATRTRRPGVVTGSHLDSVPDGGAYDGPLGVVSAFAALDGCAPTGSGPAGRSASSTSSTRRAPGSGSPAPAPG